MATVTLEGALQVFVVAITVGMMIFFAFENYKGRATWEILFVSMVEASVYTMAAAIPREYMPTFGPYNSPLIRYMSWMATCPFLIKVLLTSVSKNTDASMVNRLIAADIIMNGAGVLACMYGDDEATTKYTLFTIGSVVMIYIIRSIYAEYLVFKSQMDQPYLRGVLLILMLVSWLLFPTFYLIGPICFGLVTPATSTMLHSVGDLLAKNFFSFFAWKIARNSVVARELQAEKEEQELIKMDIISNAGAEFARASELHASINEGDGSLRPSNFGSGIQDNIRQTRDHIREQEDEIEKLKRELRKYQE